MDDIHDTAHKQQYNCFTEPTIDNLEFLRTYIYTHTNKHPRIAPHLLYNYLPIANVLGNNIHNLIIQWTCYKSLGPVNTIDLTDYVNFNSMIIFVHQDIPIFQFIAKSEIKVYVCFFVTIVSY